MPKWNWIHATTPNETLIRSAVATLYSTLVPFVFTLKYAALLSLNVSTLKQGGKTYCSA